MRDAGTCWRPYRRSAKAGNAVVDVSEQHKPGGRCRLQAEGHRIGDGSWSVPLVIHETDDGSWEIHSLGTPGVRLTSTVMVTVAESILQCAHR